MSKKPDPYLQCPNGTFHKMILTEEWKNETWYADETCFKCGYVIGVSVKGCQRSYNKEHNYVDGSFVAKDGIKFITRRCLNCEQYMQRPE